MLFRGGTTAEQPARSLATARALGYSEEQWRTLCALRDHYREWGDWFSRRELQRLRFAHWLFVKGRLQR